MARRATQKDVAQLAGVSQAAVSMVLGGGVPSTISNETVERIQAAANKLGYVPNKLARALKTQRTMTVACVVPDITNPFYPALIRGVQKVAQSHGYDVITLNSDGDAGSERHFIEWALEGRVDGVVGVFFTLRAADLKILLDHSIAVVRIESSRKLGGALAIDDIFVDSRSAANEVVRRLIALGHQRIAMVAGVGGPQGVRVEGYREALASHHLEPLVVIERSFTETAGHEAAESILDSGFAPTAVFAANDLMAIGVMQALRNRKIAVPEQMAVVGFDNIAAAPLVTPALTTVTQFQDRLGEGAAEILLQRLSGAISGPGTVHEMPFELIERGSV